MKIVFFDPKKPQGKRWVEPGPANAKGNAESFADAFAAENGYRVSEQRAKAYYLGPDKSHLTDGEAIGLGLDR